MDMLEIIIYLGIAIITGSLIVGFLVGYDYKQAYHEFKKFMIPKKEIQFEKVDTTQFANRVFKFFKDCKLNKKNMSNTLYIKDEGTLTKEKLFDIYKSLNWCDTIQSQEFDCGVREDVTMSQMQTPRVIRIECSNESLTLS